MGKKSVLVVDDDSALRRLVTLILSDAGYTVIEAPDAEAAITAEESRDVDLLVTEVAMPDMSRTELAAGLCLRRPDLPVLLIAGDPAAIDLDILSGVRVEILVKPITAESLLERVESLLRPRGERF